MTAPHWRSPYRLSGTAKLPREWLKVAFGFHSLGSIKERGVAVFAWLKNPIDFIQWGLLSLTDLGRGSWL